MKLRSFASLLTVVVSFVGLVTAQGVRNPGPPEVLTDQEQYVSFWTAETNWHSVLQLRNNSPARDLIVTPSLRAIDGTETALSPVTVKTHEVASVDLHAAMMAASTPPTSSYGSVVLRYKAVAAQVLYAALMVHRDARPIAFHIDAMGQLDNDADYLREGVWWLPNDKVSDYLILTNQGNQTMPLNLSLYDTSGKRYAKPLALASRAVMRLSVRQLIREGNLSGSYGGIQVHALAHSRALDTLHVIYDEDAGFSALLKMFDHDPVANIQQRDFGKKGVWTIRAPMLALAHPDPALFIPYGTVLEPKIFLRNTTSKPITANLVFYWRSASKTGTTKGPTILLDKHETREVRVSELPQDQAPPQDAYWSSIAISTSSQPDELVAVAASYDPTLKYGAQTPFSDQLSYLWEGGEWLADASHNSLITVGNAGLKPMKARFTLFYNQGANRYELEQSLEPNEQMWVNVGDLIQTGRPDIHGSTLPKTLTSGSYQFRDLTNPGVGSLFEGKVIYDLTNGHVTYGCAACCSPRSVFMSFDPFMVGLGSGASDGVSEQDTCGDPVEDITNQFPLWATTNSTIASTNNVGYHTGHAFGTTTTNANGTVIRTNGRNACIQVPSAPSGPTQVPPQVTITGPTTVLSGQTITLVASGTPQDTTATYSWISSSPNATVTSTGATAVVTGASVGAATITVTYTLPAAEGSAKAMATQPVSVTAPIPINFTNAPPTKTPNGTLIYQYTFMSSSGNVSDLTACRVGESVFYPNYPAPTYIWPLPMVQSTPDPTVILGPATGGGFQDSNLPPANYQTPYSSTSFQTTQRLVWSCSNYQQGSLQYFLPDITITRQISQAPGGAWIYTITKGSDTNSATLP
jgi:hypothetical protein